MSTQTTNLGLIKPDLTDNADIAVLNQNADKIDAAVPFKFGIESGKYGYYRGQIFTEFGKSYVGKDKYEFPGVVLLSQGGILENGYPTYRDSRTTRLAYFGQSCFAIDVSGMDGSVYSLTVETTKSGKTVEVVLDQASADTINAMKLGESILGHFHATDWHANGFMDTILSGTTHLWCSIRFTDNSEIRPEYISKIIFQKVG